MDLLGDVQDPSNIHAGHEPGFCLTGVEAERLNQAVESVLGLSVKLQVRPADCLRVIPTLGDHLGQDMEQDEADTEPPRETRSGSGRIGGPL
jgi:hypothetical protein